MEPWKGQVRTENIYIIAKRLHAVLSEQRFDLTVKASGQDQRINIKNVSLSWFRDKNGIYVDGVTGSALIVLISTGQVIYCPTPFYLELNENTVQITYLHDSRQEYVATFTILPS